VTVATKQRSPRRARISRKTIAWGMPDVIRCLRCEYSCPYSLPQRARGCGCIGHPAFPAPSDFSGRDVKANLARNLWREREVVFGYGAV
jgi:hypothetical protein